MGHGSADRTPQWSVRGTDIIGNAGQSIYAISTVDWYSHPVLPKDGLREFSPALSVTRRLAYVSVEPLRPRFTLEVTNVRGDDSVEVPGARGGPPFVWTPDGDRLLYVRSSSPDAPGENTLATWSPDGGPVVEWPTSDVRAVKSVAYSPDGARVVLGREYRHPSMRSISVGWSDGTGEREMIADPGLSLPGWTPDGRISYAITNEDGAVLYRVHTDGQGLESVDLTTYEARGIEIMIPEYRSRLPFALTDAEALGFVHAVKPSPDGTRTLLFTVGQAPQAPYRHIFLLTDGDPILKRLPTESTMLNPFASWSPDGSQIAVHDTGVGRTVLLTQDGEYVRTLFKDDTGLQWIGW